MVYMVYICEFLSFSRRQIPEEQNPLFCIGLYVCISVKQKSCHGRKTIQIRLESVLKMFLMLSMRWMK
jgi:hypothetical protein